MAEKPACIRKKFQGKEPDRDGPGIGHGTQLTILKIRTVHETIGVSCLGSS